MPQMGCQLVLRVSQRVTASPATKPKPYCNTHSFSILKLCPSPRDNVNQKKNRLTIWKKKKQTSNIHPQTPSPVGGPDYIVCDAWSWKEEERRRVITIVATQRFSRVLGVNRWGCIVFCKGFSQYMTIVCILGHKNMYQWLNRDLAK